MIKCDLGIVKIEGNKYMIKSELLTLIFSLKENKILTEEEISECVDKGLHITDEEIEKVTDEMTDEMTDKLKKILEILED